METAELYDRARLAWGRHDQTAKAVEELAELTYALSGVLRGDDSPLRLSNVAEEIADVRIMLEQLERFYTLENEVGQWRVAKLMRLEKRVRFAEWQESGGIDAQGT